MKQFWTYIFSSVGQKQLMALSGLGWGLFALAHMLGNLLILCGDEVYNKYSHALVSNPGIFIAEFGLFVLLLTHVFYGIKLSLENSKARTIQYSVSKTASKEASLVSRTMKYQGIVILCFIVLHLINFKFGTEYMITYDGAEVRDLFRLVVEKFQSPLYVGIYIISISLLGFHLSHGLYSSIQSLGFYHDKYMFCIQRCSVIYGLIIGLGFSITPIYIFFFH